MGEEIQRRHFDAEDFRRFRRNLDTETHLVADLFERDELSGRGDMVGFELEAWIVNADGHPHPVNERLLEIVDNPLVVPELAAFNVELNGSPSALQGNVFSRIHDELSATWEICRHGAAELGCRLATIGILPTIRPELLNSAHMSSMVRYQALNDRILALRDGAPLHINITTGDGLDMHHDDVMLEAAATSFQIHLQCKPERAVRDFNAAIIASAPMVALAANSPFLFGRSLWEETRIPLFEQAVSAGPRAPARVTFGTGYAKESLAEIFAENQREHPILLPFVQPDEPSHKYAHVRFQNGTVWRWNRPLLGFDFDGVPHLRIEHRVVPAGPTIVDCVANSAAWLGMVRGLVEAAGARRTPPRLSSRQRQLLRRREVRPRRRPHLARRQAGHRGGLVAGRVAAAGGRCAGTARHPPSRGRPLHRHGPAAGRRQPYGCPMAACLGEQARRRLGGADACLHRRPGKRGAGAHMVAVSVGGAGSLNVLGALPASIAQLPAAALADALGGPTLFDLRKPDVPPLFVSVLLHGNETSGWNAIRRLVGQVSGASVLLFVGNVEAARRDIRSVPGGLDFNRVWAGGDTPEAAIADEVTALVAAARPYLAVDIHNNTGDNPPYAVVTDTRPRTLSVARAFAQRALLTAQPDGFLSRRFADFCTAVTIEVGMPRDAESTERATSFLSRLLTSAAAPDDDPGDLALFETTARVLLDDGAVIEPAVQRFNFRSAPAGTALTRSGPLVAEDAGGGDVTDAYLANENGAMVLKHDTHVAMYTGSEESARLDCLCYLLQPFNGHRHG